MTTLKEALAPIEVELEARLAAYEAVFAREGNTQAAQELAADAQKLVEEALMEAGLEQLRVKFNDALAAFAEGDATKFWRLFREVTDASV